MRRGKRGGGDSSSNTGNNSSSSSSRSNNNNNNNDNDAAAAARVPKGIRRVLTRQFAELRELLSHFWSIHAVRFPQSKRDAAFSLVAEFERRHASVSSSLSRASVRELPEKRRQAVDAMAAPLLLQLERAIATFDEWHVITVGKPRPSSLAGGGAGGGGGGGGGGFVEVVE